MKAILVKNDEFETIGFTVRDKGNNALFQWRISDTLTTNYRKELNVEENLEKIFKLVKLQGKKEEAANAVSRFFDVATLNNIIAPGKGINCKLYEKNIENLDREMEKIIKNLA